MVTLFRVSKIFIEEKGRKYGKKVVIWITGSLFNKNQS